MTQPATAPEKNDTPFPTSKDHPGQDKALDSTLEENRVKPQDRGATQTPAKPQDDVPAEDTLDDAIEESFPASDPVSVTTKKSDDTQT